MALVLTSLTPSFRELTNQLGAWLLIGGAFVCCYFFALACHWTWNWMQAQLFSVKPSNVVQIDERRRQLMAASVGKRL